MANPLFNLMNPNMENIVNGFLNGNPQTMLMNALKSKNPQAYEQLTQLMQSGADPNQVLNQMVNNLTPEQKQQAKQMAQQFGIK